MPYSVRERRVTLPAKNPPILSPIKRVLTVCDSRLTAIALARVVEEDRRLRVCGQANNASLARELFVHHQPAIVLLGLATHRWDAITLIKDFRKSQKTAAIIVISSYEDVLLLQRAFRAGARAYLADSDDVCEILTAVDEVSAGRLYVSSSMLQRLLQSVAIDVTDSAKFELNALSDRELQVFSLIGRGFGASKLASELHLSVKTIETHQSHIKDKLGLRSAAELSEKATRWMVGLARQNLRLRRRITSLAGKSPG